MMKIFVLQFSDAKCEKEQEGYVSTDNFFFFDKVCLSQKKNAPVAKFYCQISETDE